MQNYGAWPQDLLVIMAMYAGDLMRDGLNSASRVDNNGGSPFRPHWRHFCVHECRNQLAFMVERLAIEGFGHTLKTHPDELPLYADDRQAPYARVGDLWVRRSDHSPLLETIFDENKKDSADCTACTIPCFQTIREQREQAASRNPLLTDPLRVLNSREEPLFQKLLPGKRKKIQAPPANALPLQDVPPRFDRFLSSFDDYSTAEPVAHPQQAPSLRGLTDLTNEQRRELSAIDYGFRTSTNTMHIQTLTPNTSHHAAWMCRGLYRTSPYAWFEEFEQPSHPGREFVDVPDISYHEAINDLCPGEVPDAPEIPAEIVHEDLSGGVVYRLNKLECSREDLVASSVPVTHFPPSVISIMMRVIARESSNCYDAPPETLHDISEALSEWSTTGKTCRERRRKVLQHTDFVRPVRVLPLTSY